MTSKFQYKKCCGSDFYQMWHMSYEGECRFSLNVADIPELIRLLAGIRNKELPSEDITLTDDGSFCPIGVRHIPWDGEQDDSTNDIRFIDKGGT